MKKTTRPFTTGFRNFGRIIIPAGIKVSNNTAAGVDNAYNFVDEFNWVDDAYPEIAKTLKMDMANYGIHIPSDYLEEAEEPTTKPVQQKQNRDAERCGQKIFPNGLTSYLETFYQFAEILSLKRNAIDQEPENSLVSDTNEERGTGGFWELADALTFEFENKYEGVAWGLSQDDGEKELPEYFDAIDHFFHEKEQQHTQLKNQ